MLKSRMLCSSLRMKFGLWLAAFALACPLLSAQTATFTNKGLKLDGNGSYVQLPPDIFKGLTQATIEVWAKWKDFHAFGRLIEGGKGYQSVSIFNNSTNNDLRYNIYPQYSKYDNKHMHVVTAKGLLRSNEWMHIAAVSGPGGMKLYANGRLVGQHTNTTTFGDIPTPHTNVIGHALAGNPSDKDFFGDMDEIRVWDHARSITQIRDFMFKRLNGDEEGLTHLWNFDDGTARDSGPNRHHGKFIGKARVGTVDLDLNPIPKPAPAPVVAAVAPPPAPAPTTNAAAAPVPIHVAVTAPPSTSNAAVWWIAGSLVSLAAMLACLIMMLRRSGLGSTKMLPGGATQALPPASGAVSTPPVDDSMKEKALADLTDFAKQSLVQGLYSQRAALLEVHQKAQQELAALEARVIALHLPDRIQAYEKRIAELERELETRGDELRELTKATLEVFRQKLAEEKLKDPRGGHLN